MEENQEPKTINAAFTYHAPTEAHVAKIQNVRIACDQAMSVILKNVPKCAEQTLAIRKLEESFAYCSKAIVFDGERYLG